MYALEIDDLRKIYPGGFEALKGITLSVKKGDFYALLGPNGAGKSTTIGIISSLVNKTSGSVKVFGHNIDTHLELAKQHLGLVPQEFNFNQFEKVFDILITQAGYFGIAAQEAKPRAEHLLKALGLWDKRDNKARALSGGMKRRLMIARALIHRPKLLILDEPTAGVDIELRRSMWEFMQQINEEEGTTIILTTHYLEEAEQLCKRIAILDHGEIRINTEMKDLLAQLSVETFIFDLQAPAEQEIQLQGVTDWTQPDASTLEVTLTEGETLNRVFGQLNEQRIEIASMRNKANRLEELFMRLVEHNLDTSLSDNKEADNQRATSI